MSIKTTICVTVDYDIIAELRARRDKISPIVNNLLRTHLNLFKDEEAIEKAKSLEEVNIRIAEKMGQMQELRKQRERLEVEDAKKKEKEDQGWVDAK